MLGAMDKRVSEEVRSREGQWGGGQLGRAADRSQTPELDRPPAPHGRGHRRWSGSASGHPPRLPSQGMKVSCTHFQCAAGAFAYLREHFPQAFSVDMSRQILTLNVNLMLVSRIQGRGQFGLDPV